MSYQYPFVGADVNLIDSVWAKGNPINPDSKGNSYDPNIWRWDICGKVMKYSEHGDRNSEHGWEIDHSVPTARGGGNELSNLQPLNWKMNAAKSDNHPWRCP